MVSAGAGAAAKDERITRAAFGLTIILTLVTLAWALRLSARVGGVVIGIAGSVRAGVPWWISVWPILGLVTLFLLVRRTAETLMLAALASIAWGIATGPCVVALDQVGALDSAQNWLWGTALLLTAEILSAAWLADRQAVHLDSWMSKLAYGWRLTQMKSIRDLADRCQWELTGPVWRHRALIATGRWRELDAALASLSVHYRPAGTSIFMAQVHTSRPLRSLLCSSKVRPSRRDSGWEKKAFLGTTGRKVAYFVRTPDRTEGCEAEGSALSAVLARGSRFLTNPSALRVDKTIVHFERRDFMKGLQKESDIETLLDWLVDVARALEADGLAECAAHDESTGMADHGSE